MGLGRLKKAPFTLQARWLVESPSLLVNQQDAFEFSEIFNDALAQPPLALVTIAGSEQHKIL